MMSVHVYLRRKEDGMNVVRTLVHRVRESDFYKQSYLSAYVHIFEEQHISSFF
jgi:hypothetical protein